MIFQFKYLQERGAIDTHGVHSTTAVSNRQQWPALYISAPSFDDAVAKVRTVNQSIRRRFTSGGIRESSCLVTSGASAPKPATFYATSEAVHEYLEQYFPGIWTQFPVESSLCGNDSGSYSSTNHTFKLRMISTRREKQGVVEQLVRREAKGGFNIHAPYEHRRDKLTYIHPLDFPAVPKLVEWMVDGERVLLPEGDEPEVKWFTQVKKILPKEEDQSVDISSQKKLAKKLAKKPAKKPAKKTGKESQKPQKQSAKPREQPLFTPTVTIDYAEAGIEVMKSMFKREKIAMAEAIEKHTTFHGKVK